LPASIVSKTLSSTSSGLPEEQERAWVEARVTGLDASAFREPLDWLGRREASVVLLERGPRVFLGYHLAAAGRIETYARAARAASRFVVVPR
jgi:hypothetical protein